jgi:hypothetical protein
MAGSPHFATTAPARDEEILAVAYVAHGLDVHATRFPSGIRHELINPWALPASTNLMNGLE